MTLAVLYSRATAGVAAPLVTVEVHLANGLPSLSIVGLPEMAVRESKDRVRGALLNSSFEFPLGRITVNLAPADLPKEGGRFDLAIALGILVASGQVPRSVCENREFLGELALSGKLRPVKGVLPVALATRETGRELVLSSKNAAEAGLVSGLAIRSCDYLLQTCSEDLGRNSDAPERAVNRPLNKPETSMPDLIDVRGQAHAKRALEIAAAGSHGLLMIGPPGAGKSLLASCLPGILPKMSDAEALETAAVRSVSHQGFSVADWGRRPFRTPHHTASGVALVGGGSDPRPGEISLAHNGVLFLDELPEFDRRVLEVLREPMESGRISISRAARQAEFPARFQLVAAMNPCPCGQLGDQGGKPCRCTGEQVARYRQRISGPLMDRIDMQVEVPRLGSAILEPGDSDKGESSACVRARIESVRGRQNLRAGCANGSLDSRQIDRWCRLDPKSREILSRAVDELMLSGRAAHRILRLARTIADLEDSDEIRVSDLSEAIGYRRLDRNI